MNTIQSLDHQIKEAANKVHDLNDALEKAKEDAFQQHEIMLLAGNNNRKSYNLACKKREYLKEELLLAETELNRLKSIDLDSKYKKEEIRNSYAGKSILNIAFAIFGICAAILLRKLFT